MNDLFSGSFSRFKNQNNNVDDDDDDKRKQGRRSGGTGVEMSSSSSSAAMGANLDKFFEDVEGIKDELKEIETIHARLQSSNEQTKTLHNPQSIKTLRLNMDSDVSLALKKAKLIKVRLEALDRTNAATRTLPGCGPGSSSDRTRTSLVSSLRQKLRGAMESFSQLRERIQADYKETVRRRVYAVTGEEAGEEAVEAVIAAGEGEGIVRRALEGQGEGVAVAEVVREVRERYDAVREVERGMEELRQVFLDMAVVVEAQGAQLDDIESQVARASSFVRTGAARLETARNHQKNSRKWTCIALLILIVIVLVIVLPIVLRNRGGGGGGGGGTNNAASPPPPPPTPT